MGGLRKSDVREIAQAQGFCIAAKPDSQDICFVPNGDYAHVIALHSTQPPCPGNFLDLSGNVLGRHRGIIHYTIGQRKGLGLSFQEPHYVCKISPETNTITLGGNCDLYEKTLIAADFNWISGLAPKQPVRCKAKIRYRQMEQSATAAARFDGTVEVAFDTPQRAITPGQAVVLYDGEVVLGGGTIQSSRNS